jgi:tRNA U34 5-methylaminomethyl-2-thiouridine-forming methyltransferase MnmC
MKSRLLIKFAFMENPFESILIETSDGSHTLKLKAFDEQYHSVNGALQESVHVFLNSGLKSLDPLANPLFVLEVGLGTGLNALLTAREAIMTQAPIFYEAIEPYPLPPDIVQKLNYHTLFEESWMSDVFQKIHAASSQQYTLARYWFHIKCMHQQIQELDLDVEKYHLVYFDAFGPDTQPEMWTEEVFKKIYDSMMPGGVLVTYCVKGVVRRAMKAAGLDVKKIPGPAGKREMSRAVKPLANTNKLKSDANQ